MEPYVDAGRELETPWRISRGEALYRDVRFYHGPLGPYLAAAVDRAAGPWIPARIALAGLIALASLEGLRRLAGRLLSPGRTAMAVMAGDQFTWIRMTFPDVDMTQFGFAPLPALHARAACLCSGRMPLRQHYAPEVFEDHYVNVDSLTAERIMTSLGLEAP